VEPAGWWSQALCTGLTPLFYATDPTSRWAPPGSPSDERLSKDLDEFYKWVEALLVMDTTDEHG
jgi:hypothetical protein